MTYELCMNAVSCTSAYCYNSYYYYNKHPPHSLQPFTYHIYTSLIFQRRVSIVAVQLSKISNTLLRFSLPFFIMHRILAQFWVPRFGVPGFFFWKEQRLVIVI